jgi:hypothetical protein
MPPELQRQPKLGTFSPKGLMPFAAIEKILENQRF